MFAFSVCNMPIPKRCHCYPLSAKPRYLYHEGALHQSIVARFHEGETILILSWFPATHSLFATFLFTSNCAVLFVSATTGLFLVFLKIIGIFLAVVEIDHW